MKIKGFSKLFLLMAAVLFSYGIASGQNQTTNKTTAQPSTTTSNPRVVVTDNLSKPAVSAQAATQPTTKTTKYGGYSVNVTDNVAAQPSQSSENGKFYSVTTWDGTKWVTTRKFMPNPPKPNP